MVRTSHNWSVLVGIAPLFLCALSGAPASAASARHPRHLITPAPTATAAAAAEESFTAISGCHKHGSEAFCQFGTTELQVLVPTTVTSALPAEFTDCHSHGSDSFCVGPDGEDVEVLGVESAEGGEEEEHHQDEEGGGERHCHFHAGVEHCVGGDESEEAQCSRQDREYNIKLRIGLLFVMLVAGFIGAAGPIVLSSALPARFELVFTIFKQFGTGVIISTAFVHLFTHASLMFNNECLGELSYEATTAAIAMAGLFIAFLVEYVSHRVAKKYWSKSRYSDEVVSVLVLEAGIIFHSILIGITVVVAGDSYFATLFVVIIFHQAFEGFALGSRIAAVGKHSRHWVPGHHGPSSSLSPPSSLDNGDEKIAAPGDTLPVEHAVLDSPKALSTAKKYAMAGAFAITTPIGMAIGIGALNSFNGNDPSTIIAIGTLDAVSAGILVWIGVVEMWAGDWMFGGELEHAGPVVSTLAMLSLAAGLVLMSVLGKWA